ncbi:hypothetical protein [Aquisalibacillus elongatus]|uniref:Uncharacterized protein n=1 Tax=Aquisalibacillus elongatus TaxID=485577 RepID=A0A3N5CBK6_9BACI|nr:hypothetical protein [Aquisalibacillus elongatus]RPF54231.1 hypothetical protein EDC24_1424 [Aquisalibacillus elongatus]
MLGWTFTAWLVVFIIPALITGFSIVYYVLGKNEQQEEDES